MFELENGKCYDSQYLTDWASNTHIKSSSVAAEIWRDFENQGVLMLEKNGEKKKLGNHEWARLCISYCLAQIPVKDWEKPKDMNGTEVPSFNTMFNQASKTGEEKFWLAYICHRLFHASSPKTKHTKKSLHGFVVHAWHNGAIGLWTRYQKALNAYDNNIVEAKKILFAELAELANQPRHYAANTFSGSLKNLHDNPQDLDIAPESCATMGKRIVEALQSMGKGVKQIWFLGQGVRYDFYRLQFAEFNDWDRIHEPLCSALGLDENGLWAERDTACGLPHTFKIKMKRDANTWKNLDKSAFQAALKSYSDNMLLPLCIGADEMGQAVFADLHEARHVLVGGTPGSGKSVMVRTLLHSLFEFLPSHTAQIAILDATGDYVIFKDKPNLWDGEIKGNRNEVLGYLEQFVEEMKARLTLLQKYGADHISRLPENVRPPYFIVMVEELAALLDSDKHIETPLVELLQEGRKAGILLIMATQELDSATFSKRLRAVIPSRIAMRVTKATSSKMILEETGAEKLAGSGDHLVRWNGGEKQFLHGYNV